MIDKLDEKLLRWRDATEGIELPPGLIERIHTRIQQRASQSDGVTGLLLEGLGEDEIGEALERGLTGAPELETLAVARAAVEPPRGEPQWYLGVDDRRLGPLTPERVQELWAAGEIDLETPCWRVGFSDWLPIARVPELGARLTPRARPSAAALPAPVEPAPTPEVPLFTMVRDELNVLKRPEEEEGPAPRSETVLQSAPVEPERPVRPRRWLRRGGKVGLLVAVEVAVLTMVVHLVRPPAPAPVASVAQPSPAPALEVEFDEVAAPVPIPVAPSRPVAAPEPSVAPKPGGLRREASKPPRSPIDDVFENQFESGPATGGDPPQGGQVLESLSTSDIMQVVLSHKREILECGAAHRRSHPGQTGTLVMRWRIRPNGRTTDISVATPAFEGSDLGACLKRLIKDWTFPRHRKQREPIDFPFRFTPGGSGE